MLLMGTRHSYYLLLDYISLTIHMCSCSDRNAVLSKLFSHGPHTYGVLSVWFKRGQLSTGDVRSNVINKFTFTLWSVANLIASDYLHYVVAAKTQSWMWL